MSVLLVDDDDGHALVQRMRALPAARGGATPAIALTGYANRQDRVAALRAGLQMRVCKPVTPAELGIAVAKRVACARAPMLHHTEARARPSGTLNAMRTRGTPLAA